MGTSSESNLEAPNLNYLPLHWEEIVFRMESNYSFGFGVSDKGQVKHATGGVRPAVYVDINKLKDI